MKTKYKASQEFEGCDAMSVKLTIITHWGKQHKLLWYLKYNSTNLEYAPPTHKKVEKKRYPKDSHT